MLSRRSALIGTALDLLAGLDAREAILDVDDDAPCRWCGAGPRRRQRMRGVAYRITGGSPNLQPR
ncbi:hypothetical protein [Streptomyces sp. NBC_01435]|uniref:hypothetical protein n=1 Tax=Streptomyces sp. NBC_01435 TaxID=2903865 RepID=UPI002E33E26C|nr:hypothetical protein [Streptomyces sp. NBC_01435]